MITISESTRERLNQGVARMSFMSSDEEKRAAAFLLMQHDNLVGNQLERGFVLRDLTLANVLLTSISARRRRVNLWCTTSSKTNHWPRSWSPWRKIRGDVS